jgi:fructan beta-fructosidase
MRSVFATCTVTVVFAWISTAARAAGPDIVLADFEGKDYGDWKTTGEAFGPGPAQGTLSHQMEVSGYLGHGLANCVDQIVESDRKPDLLLRNQKREIVLEKQFLNLPVKSGAPKRRMQVLIDGKPVRIFDIELAGANPDFWAFTDLSAYKGKTATLLVDRLPEGSPALAAIEQADQIRDTGTVYKEKLRPQFHYTQKRGWNNDPNGLVHYRGEWHLFYQHNPYGCGWANMHWGHAVSRDLVHWRELPIALYPWTMAKDHCFSGSAAVDWNNTAGFQTGEDKALVAAFTDTGCGESLAYSNDRGRTWTCWPGNPVLKHSGRDPKIIWYAPGKHWVMAMYDNRPPYGDNIGIATSPDLKHWTWQSHIPGFFECAEIFELPVDGDKSNTRWVVYAADAKYAIGRFDGKRFTPEHPGKQQVHWGRYYASQTFNDSPDGRKIQIGWGTIDMPGMPFNQMMTFPCQLTLRTTPEGIRMFAQPVKEIETLRAGSQVRQDVALAADKPLSVPVSGDLFDIRAEFRAGPAKAFGLSIGGRKIVYDAAQKTLEGMPLLPVDGTIRIQLLVDRPSLEICGNQGRVYQTREFRAAGPVQAVQAWSEGAATRLIRLEVHELKSAWE